MSYNIQFTYLKYDGLLCKCWLKSSHYVPNAPECLCLSCLLMCSALVRHLEDLEVESWGSVCIALKKNSLFKPNMMVHPYNSGIWKVETGGSRGQAYPRLHSELEGSMRSCLEKEKEFCI